MASFPEIHQRDPIGPDLEEQNRQLEIERAVLTQKAECLLEKLELMNKHRTAEMKLYESFLKNIKEIWAK